MGSQRVRHDWADKTSNYSSDPPWMRLQCSHCPFWLAHVCQGSPSSGFSLFFQVVILYYHEAMGMTLGTGWCSCDQWHRILGHLLTQLTGTLWFCSACSGCIISNMWCLLLLCLAHLLAHLTEPSSQWEVLEYTWSLCAPWSTVLCWPRSVRNSFSKVFNFLLWVPWPCSRISGARKVVSPWGFSKASS